ncbi:MAG: phosphatase PAP2 family protein [Bacteroidota bacterium]
MATYLFSLLAVTLPAALEPVSSSGHRTFIFLIFIVTFLLPVLTLGIFKTFGTISTFAMPDRKERIVPFVFISVIYAAITYLFFSRTRISLQDNFLKLMIVIDLLVITATLATFVIKISLHSLAIWGFMGIILILNRIFEMNTLFYPLIVVIVLAGVIMSSRLYLNVHTLREVMWGSILGLCTSMSAMAILF